MLKWLFLVPFMAFAASQDPWLAPIQEAQKLVVAKNRKAAAQKLVQAIRTNKWPARGRTKLIEALNDLSVIFFTDQGQRLYETGQSLAYDTPDTAISSFRDALAIEDSNVIVLLAISRLQLARGDCRAADSNLKQVEEINPFDETLHFLQAKTLLCSHRPVDALALLKSEPTDDPVKSVTLAAALIENGSIHEAMPFLQKAAIKDNAFPEVHYWIWKVSKDQADVAEEQGMKYVALCKNLNLRTRRKYMNEPRLCAQSQEVEDALKASDNNS